MVICWPARSERPRTAVEAQIAAILEELLGQDHIGLDDNFFSLGGTSLLGMRYLARVNDVFNVRLGAAAVLRAPTVVRPPAVRPLRSASAMPPSIPRLAKSAGVRSR